MQFAAFPTISCFQLFYYDIFFNRLRELKTARLGHLISIQGTVTRTSEVRPELMLATFECMECHVIISNVPQQFRYTEVFLKIVHKLGYIILYTEVWGIAFTLYYYKLLKSHTLGFRPMLLFVEIYEIFVISLKLSSF